MSIRTRTVGKISGRGMVLVLILAFVVIEFVHRNLGSLSIVEGSSMYPTFKPHDVVQARTATADSQRGDVVIITDNRGGRAIKRVLGLPGETVAIYKGCVFVDRQKLHEPYLSKTTYTFKSDQRNERVAVWHLGADEYFVLGDNRLESFDSRHYGPVRRGQINRVVDLPDNAARPEFCEIMLAENGRVVPGKYNRASRNSPRAVLHASNEKT